MSRFIISGRSRLSGEIKVSGAKNAALKLFAAAVLSDEECHFKNVPDIADIRTMAKLLNNLGAEIRKENKNEYFIRCQKISKIELDPGLVVKLRASVVLIAPLLSRFGEVKFPHPGGCVIGKRPIDMYLDNFRSLGAKVIKQNNFYHIKAEKLKGAKFIFPWISHTATESAILASALASGKTILVNSACEPEVSTLCDWLNRCGAKISGVGTHRIEIEGVKKLSGGTFSVIPDRIETGTFAILAAATCSAIKITNCDPSHLETFWKMLERAGVKFDIGENFVYIKPSPRPLACEARTHEYPGFVTDLQAPFTVLMTQASGTSLIHETIYEGRLFYTDILNRMGANIIMCDPHRVVVSGPTKLFGIKMESPDIRAGIALVIAALIAEGESVIENIEQVDRGYENIDERLRSLGAKIERVK
jgi:UDP-N-acetylglucosamine 1-carboxyvinyltransferase